MKTFLGRLDPRAHKGAPPWVCVLINQAACPGLGTVLAGQRFGFIQAGLMIAGFCLAMAFFGWFLIACVRYLMSNTWDEGEWRTHYASGFWLLKSGGGLCIIAWLWALISSVAILRKTKPSSP